MRLFFTSLFLICLGQLHANESVLLELYRKSDVVAEIKITKCQSGAFGKWGGPTVVNYQTFTAQVIQIFKGRTDWPEHTLQFTANIFSYEKPLGDLAASDPKPYPDILTNSRLIVFLSLINNKLHLSDQHCGIVAPNWNVISDLKRYAELKNK